MTMASTMARATTKIDSQEYSFFRNARAPFWISVMRKTMRSSPGEAAPTSL
jgi:hypothetical protein